MKQYVPPLHVLYTGASDVTSGPFSHIQIPTRVGSEKKHVCLANAGEKNHHLMHTYILRTYIHTYIYTYTHTYILPTDHLLWQCDLLKKQRQVLRNSITKAGGNWPITNLDLANKYTKFFQRFVNTINFDIL